MNHLKLLVAVGSLAIVSPAIAKQCPSGQILRVSKGVCMSKAAATKAGIIAGHHGKSARVAHADRSAPESKAPGRQVSNQSQDETVAQDTGPSAGTSVIPKSSAQQPLGFVTPPQETASSAPSPFGGLSLSGLTR